VRDLFAGDQDAAAITAMVELARKLGVTVVAEGIEEVAQAERLRQLHCGVGQGYVHGHPQPAALVGEALARRRSGQAATAA
jgi:EAL domain-containing protein (putative c-di-GMP-specific phosphodiesterase class I)